MDKTKAESKVTNKGKSKTKEVKEVLQEVAESPTLHEAETSSVGVESNVENAPKVRPGRPVRTRDQEIEFLDKKLLALKERRRRLIEEKLIELDSEITRVESRKERLLNGPSESDELLKDLKKAMKVRDLAEVQRIAELLKLLPQSQVSPEETETQVA